MFKINDGDCIGGYRKIDLSSDDANHNIWSDEMLFNLSCQRLFPLKSKVFYGQPPRWTGTSFVGGNDELEAVDEPYNGDGNFISLANQHSYRIPLDSAGINMLTN